MEENIVEQIKELLLNKSLELFNDSYMITNRLSQEELNTFEERFDSEFTYFDKKYFNEDKFEYGIRRLFSGEFPIEEFTSEANDYRRLYVYNRAVVDFVSELEGHV